MEKERGRERGGGVCKARRLKGQKRQKTVMPLAQVPRETVKAAAQPLCVSNACLRMPSCVFACRRTCVSTCVSTCVFLRLVFTLCLRTCLRYYVSSSLNSSNSISPDPSVSMALMSSSMSMVKPKSCLMIYTRERRERRERERKERYIQEHDGEGNTRERDGG